MGTQPTTESRCVQTRPDMRGNLKPSSVPELLRRYRGNAQALALKLDVEGKPQSPFFFRLGDLGAAYDQQKEANQPGLADTPAPRMLPLTSVANMLETGQLGEDTLLVAASDAAAVVQRMQGGSDSFASGEGANSGSAPEPGMPEDPFFLKVPWANGKVK